MSVIETLRIDQWLYEALSGDAVLSAAVDGRIYSYLASQSAALPFIMYSRQTGRDVLGVGAARIIVHEVYQVKVVGPGSSFSTIKTIADRIDTVLHGASGNVADGSILMCVREQTIAYVETESGRRYNHLGGLYHIIAQ